MRKFLSCTVSIPLKIRYDQIFFMVPHRGTEITEKTEPPCSLRLCAGFFYDPTQRHGDHREKQSLRVLCGFVWDIGLRPSPESVIISLFQIRSAKMSKAFSPIAQSTSFALRRLCFKSGVRK